MKNGILSNFYFGNITPTDRQMVKGSQAERATKELSDADPACARCSVWRR